VRLTDHQSGSKTVEHETSTDRPMKIVLLEDSPTDAILIEREIRKQLGNVEFSVVDSEAGYREQLLNTPPAIVIADYRLPGFSGLEALAIAREFTPLMPFILVTGAQSEEVAVDSIHRGADDYVLKDNLGRIGTAVRNALERQLTRREHADAVVRLQQSEARLAAIVNTAMDAIISVDDSHRMIFFNKAAERMFLRPASDVLGRPFTMLLPERLRPSASSDGQQGGTVEHPTSWIYPVIGLRATGEEFPVEASMSTSDTPHGRLHTFILRDITERRRAEDDIRKSEERYRRFFEDDLTGDFIAAPEGTILDCNPAFARIFGFGSVKEAIGLQAGELYPPLNDMGMIRTLLGAKEKIEHYEQEARTRDGKALRVTCHLVGQFDDQHQLLQIKGYVFDDSQRMALEQQLMQAQRLDSVARLAGGVAHDFSNILNNLIGFASQLKKHAQDAAKVLKYASSIEKSATRGAELSNQLLALVRRKQREETVVDVGPIIEEVVTLCTETFPKNITVRATPAPRPWSIKGDRGALYQVLLNLCLNARDAIIEKGVNGVITIDTANLQFDGPTERPALLAPNVTSAVKITVNDNGGGIPVDIVDKIFDPFFTTKATGSGAGLGLAIVYNVVKSHNGTLMVDPVKGEGAAFHIFLPSAELPVETKQEEKQAEPQRGHEELVLLVDDEEPMRELGQELLQEHGYRVITACDGAEGVEIYKRLKDEIALVILDLLMPNMDGGQAYMEMRRINPELRALFCTGYVASADIQELLQEEDLRVLQKPVHPVDLLKTVKEVLGRPEPIHNRQ
jgi:two-component system, cell cycle sensor histidine kinase and response regulator CckA